VAICGLATANFTAHKKQGNKIIAHKSGTRTATHTLETLEAGEKPRCQLVTELLTDHKTEGVQNTNINYKHIVTQIKSLIEITTQRFGNWF